MKLLHYSIYLLVIIIPSQQIAQQKFSRKDSLRGSLRMERNYDVSYYDLQFRPSIPDQSISGSVEMEFKPNEDLNSIQVDLFENMQIQKIMMGSRELKYKREYDALFISGNFKKDESYTVKIQYSGKPVISKLPPWDGGFTWTKDSTGKNWISVSCEGAGASLWWPNKDHLSDEPEKGMAIHITVPPGLMAISNGNLERITEDEKKNKTYHWKVSYPINNYNVSFYIGDYVHFNDQYQSKDGSTLSLDYYVLRYNEEKARNHFAQVKKMLEAYEHYFEKYPFWNDGYALVESPFLGMEHQSAIAYGNHYQRGYLGGRIPDEFNFDYLIIHESGHEYFGNAVSCKDHAEMWIHEGFTTYLESLYIEYMYGKKPALRYLDFQRNWIKNATPLIGPKDVNYHAFPDTDIYYKGSWALQTLRFALKNDSLWFELIRRFYLENKFKTIESEDFFRFVNDFTKKDFTPFFNQYFRRAELPKVQIKVEVYSGRTRIHYKLISTEEKLELPVELSIDGRVIQLDATTKEKNIEFSRLFKSIKAVNNQSLVEILPTE